MSLLGAWFLVGLIVLTSILGARTITRGMPR